MTHWTDTLGRAPIMRQAAPPPDTCESWRGDDLIRAPKREPVEAEAPAKMTYQERRLLVGQMTDAGKTRAEIMDTLKIPRDTYAKDMLAIERDLPAAEYGVVRGDVVKADAAYAVFLTENKMTRAYMTQNAANLKLPQRVKLGADRRACVLFIHIASGASAAMLGKVTGLSKTTASTSLARAKKAAVLASDNEIGV